MRTRAPLIIVAAGAATLIATAIAAATVPAQAASAGSLDPAFGTGGLVTVPAGVSTAGILAQPDGKILVLASVITDPATDSTDIGVLRYNPGGTLDASFGTGGEALASFPGARAFAGGFNSSGFFVQPDGKIVVAGVEDPVQGGQKAAVVRFNADGTLDTSFGSGGEVTTQFPTGNAPLGADYVGSVLVQADGKILVGGGISPCVNGRNPLCVSLTALARYNPDGTLDTSFGRGGFAVQKGSTVIAMSEDSAGDIFVQNFIAQDQPTLGEYSPAGVPDSAVTFPASSRITISSAGGFQPDGTYAVGQSVNLTNRLSGGATAASVVVKSLPSGAPVAGFSNPPFDYANQIGQGENNVEATAFQSNGDIVAAGQRCPGTARFCNSGLQLGVARLTATGSLDNTFGAGGVTTIAFSGGVSVLAIQANGDILIASGSAIFRVLG